MLSGFSCEKKFRVSVILHQESRSVLVNRHHLKDLPVPFKYLATGSSAKPEKAVFRGT